jgi:hypothetical protein
MTFDEQKTGSLLLPLFSPARHDSPSGGFATFFWCHFRRPRGTSLFAAHSAKGNGSRILRFHGA